MNFPSRVARNTHGRCLVAARELAPGEIVQRFDGPLTSFDAIPADEIRHALLVEDGRWILPTTDARFMNHACDPNCRVNAANDVITTRAVCAGEELTFAYDLVYPGEDPGPWDARWTFDCACGSPRCRRRIDKYVDARA